MTPDEVKNLRSRADLTQAELADILEVDTSAVGQWEAGLTKPSRMSSEMMRAIRRELDQREKDEWKTFIARAGGALSLAVFLDWMKGSE